MLDLVVNRDKNLSREVEQFTIKRHTDKSLESVNQMKSYKFGYDKRYILPEDEFGNVFTLPWGHKDIPK